MALPAYRVARTAHGGPPERLAFTAGGATVAGQFGVIQADDGKVNAAADDASVVVGITTNVAADTEEVIVEMATADTIYSGAIKTGTFVTADIGNAVHLDDTGLDMDTTDAGAIAIVIGSDTTDSSRVLFRVLSSAIQTSGAAYVA